MNCPAEPRTIRSIIDTIKVVFRKERVPICEIVMLSEQERAAHFTETAGKKKMTPGVVGKYFWVGWVLSHL